MFRQLILDALSDGQKSTPELYAIAKETQPRDCTDIPCSHRERPSKGDQEWKHELRRNQFQLKRDGRIALGNGVAPRLTRLEDEFRISNFDFRISSFAADVPAAKEEYLVPQQPL
ncbi:MAG: hypothetical protein WCD04_12870, partial [Terriglobia bacterium]|jgi:hypothetical protein